jgi:hypothetical protein
MYICFFNIFALMHNYAKNKFAYVRACGGDSRAHEAKLGGEKTCLF